MAWDSVKNTIKFFEGFFFVATQNSYCVCLNPHCIIIVDCLVPTYKPRVVIFKTKTNNGRLRTIGKGREYKYVSVSTFLRNKNGRYRFPAKLQALLKKIKRQSCR